MNFYLISILAFIFILGTAVVLHEFGHFIVAKLLGIRVETFSVGFGPRIFGRRWGTTDYRLSAIPLGGYVKMGGDESNSPIEGSGAENVPDHERFDLRPRWQKVAVGLAGPTMNILTALAVPFVSALLMGMPTPPTPVVSQLREGGTSAAAGLRPGDRIVSFNGVDNPTWDRIRGDALLSPEQPLPVVVERDNQRIPLSIKPTKRVEGTDSLGELDFRPDFGDAKIIISEEIEPSTPAAQAGLQAKDRNL
ncbi:MAG: site-2 protease family protein [Pyrinomonadaceae bacterium]